MPTFRDLMDLANPPGAEAESRPTRRTRGGRYVPWQQIVLGFLRAVCPILRIGRRYALVTRAEDVREVLSRPDAFAVPFAREMARLNDGSDPGTPFILGIDDPPAHRRQLRQVMGAFRADDVWGQVVPIARRRAQEVVGPGDGRLEAIHALLMRVPVDVVTGYYGVPVAEDRVEAFAAAAIAVSGHLFGLPPITPQPKIDAAADVLRQFVQRAIDDGAAPTGTVLHRMLEQGLPEPEIRAFLMGMIVGFVPTNTLAAGNMLEVLLRNPAFLEEARCAAQEGDDDLLVRCLFEAGRFMPINFGPFRTCVRDHVVAAGTSRAARIHAGTVVLACTQSAMFDGRDVERPYEFVPGRPASHLMHFGVGMHWCAGALIAQAQIAQTFKPLLVKRTLVRAPGAEGRLQTKGLFPDRLVVEYRA